MIHSADLKAKILKLSFKLQLEIWGGAEAIDTLVELVAELYRDQGVCQDLAWQSMDRFITGKNNNPDFSCKLGYQDFENALLELKISILFEGLKHFAVVDTCGLLALGYYKDMLASRTPGRATLLAAYATHRDSSHDRLECYNQCKAELLAWGSLPQHQGQHLPGATLLNCRGGPPVTVIRTSNYTTCLLALAAANAALPETPDHEYLNA